MIEKDQLERFFNANLFENKDIPENIKSIGILKKNGIVNNSVNTPTII
jgi:hypothetical protein